MNTPGGNPASSTRRANSRVDAEVCSEGFTTTVFPVASAAARLKLRMNRGEFQGVMMPTTPTGSRRVWLNTAVFSRGMVSPRILSDSPA